MKRVVSTVVVAAVLAMPAMTLDAAADKPVTIKRICVHGVCGEARYARGVVKIKLTSKLSRTTHFNFAGIPGDQIELGSGGNYRFEREPGETGKYRAQACDRGGVGSRSTCTKWAVFEWSTGDQEVEEEQ